MKASKETKKYVTPYAFGVSDDLLGKALASPPRRLLALLIDLVAVASLTLMNMTTFAIVAFIVSMVGFYKANKRTDGSMARTVFMVTAVVSIFVVVSSMVFSGSSSTSDNDEKAQISLTESSEDNQTNEYNQASKPISIIEYVKVFLSDMGLGFGWAALYFSVFIAWFNGQTLGKIFMRIKVVKIDAKSLTLWESFERYGGYSAGLATGLMGFLQIIWDPNRQAIHDKISETMVIDLRKPDKPLSET